jgi:hypothetical protein
LPSRGLGSAAFILVLFSSALALYAQAPENGATPSEVEPAVVPASEVRQIPLEKSISRELLPGAGRLIFLDPDTGRPTSTPPPGFAAQLDDLMERRQALSNGIVWVSPDGSLRAWPGPAHMHFLVATIDEDGKTRLSHQSLDVPSTDQPAVAPAERPAIDSGSDSVHTEAARRVQ